MAGSMKLDSTINTMSDISQITYLRYVGEGGGHKEVRDSTEECQQVNIKQVGVLTSSDYNTGILDWIHTV